MQPMHIVTQHLASNMPLTTRTMCSHAPPLTTKGNTSPSDGFLCHFEPFRLLKVPPPSHSRASLRWMFQRRSRLLHLPGPSPAKASRRWILILLRCHSHLLRPALFPP